MESMRSERDSNGQNYSNRDYDVGYGKPPKTTRFQKGQSGNPKGRPKGSKNLSTLLEEELEQPVLITENGRRKKITKRRASMKQLVNRAASGEHRALQILINYLHDHEKQAASSAPDLLIDEADQEIINGIFERFNNTKRASEEKDDDGEINHND
jgi:hypothetical protein